MIKFKFAIFRFFVAKQ